ncbi:hypothetical protein CASFOL_028808 [Castilleja foliolosa]|uniref:Bifunctional inhibitor/plant lipid transfer protein/seed storage helical domain-containing protein n=1 Tax=Castilleja foliolosa TaxID=1961234 RepID=A0ABD3CFA1_9LAMI
MVQKQISIFFACISIFALIFVPARTYAMTCRSALTYLLPCQPYLVKNEPLTDSCCRGINDLKQAVTAYFYRPLCLCVKQAANSAKVDPIKVERLKQFCNIHLPLPVNRNVSDCNSLPWIDLDNLRPSSTLLDSQL